MFVENLHGTQRVIPEGETSIIALLVCLYDININAEFEYSEIEAVVMDARISSSSQSPHIFAFIIACIIFAGVWVTEVANRLSIITEVGQLRFWL